MGGKKDYELTLEIGHRSAPLKHVTDEGFTHRWTVYVKGQNDAKIEHCISRIIFQLHESFANPYRVITQPPYQVKETGYAGFDLPIEVYFRNKEKPNHLSFSHNLELMKEKQHVGHLDEKIMFKNPNKEFEKCLIKAGAQVTKSKSKKDRSETPPIKKQKITSSTIPSKDMDKLNLQPQSNGTSSHYHQQSPAPSVHKNHPSSSQQSSSHKSSSKSSHHHHSQKHHSHSSRSSQNLNNGHSQQQKTSVPLVKSESNNFTDLFGAPLVYSKKQKQHISNRDVVVPTSNATTRFPSSAPKKLPRITSPPPNVGEPKNSPTPAPIVAQTVSPTQSPSPIPDSYQLMQSKISALTDSDRLQQIVDIIEEAGEWFNLTAKKFEFDLKRLDRKTIHKIEKCLH